MMLNSDWSNPSRPLDVNNDLLITPMDALLIINRLNSRSTGVLPTRTNRLDYYYDVNGDQLSTPMDVLQVINELNLRSRANGSVFARVEGEAEIGPAGFISVPFTTLPGSSGQIVTVDTTLNIGREEFNEMGLFVVDGPDGAVNGVLPSSPDYAAAVFQSSQRQVLYSKVSSFRTASSAVFPAGKQVSVYVLQPASANGDAAAHLRARESGTGQMRIGWEEQPSVVPGWPTVGDRGYDDAIVDVHIGQPVNSHAEPVITAIPNQTVIEQTLLTIQAITMDADLPSDGLLYSFDVAPAGATIDPNTGLFRWTPTEAQGPGNFEVIIRATDRYGLFDTEPFFVTVLEVNRPPVLQPLLDHSLQPGDTMSRFAVATDPDMPANRLTFSLDAGAPVGAMIDASTGRFEWTAPEVTARTEFPVTVRVTDDGTPRLFATRSFTVTVTPLVDDCSFDDQLSGWTIIESGGSTTGRGTVIASGCTVTLTEGDSFVVGLERSFTIPETPTALQFTYDSLTFDTSDPEFVNDAFEVALVDRDGNALVAPFAPGRDAFFNVTEGMQAASGQGIQVDGNTITVGLNGIPVGTEAKIIFRLANDDGDEATNVTISDFRFEDSTLISLAASLTRSADMERSFQSISSNQPSAVFPLVQPYNVSSSSDDLIGGGGNTTIGDTFTADLKWSRSTFTFRPESDQVVMTPAVGDLNQDGVPDVVFSTFSRVGNSGGSSLQAGVLRAISGKDGAELWSVVSPVSFIEAYGGIAIGDIDANGFIEVIAHTVDNRVVAFGHDSTFKWISEPIRGGGIGWGSASIADLDGDGIAEIIVGATVLNSDGAIRWEGGGGKGNNGVGPLSIVADLDLDGVPEIIAGNTAYRSDGSLFWRADVPDGFPALGNFDDDTYPEIVIVSRGSVYLLEHDGSIEWGPRPIPEGGYGGAPTVADFDGDGLPEIGVAGASRYAVFETNGDIKFAVPTQDGTSNVTGSSVFDFDGDGRAEVVYADELALRIYDGETGVALYQFDRGSGTTYEYPLIVDVDGDGKTEIVVVANNFLFGNRTGIFVLGNDSWVSTRKIWNQHTYHITNINDDGSIPRQEVNSWQVYNNYRRNLQPTGTQFGPPQLSVSSPTNRIDSGSTVLLSGFAIVDGFIAANERNAITNVTANGLPVMSLDATGQFFEPVTIQPGINDFIFVATDAAGQQASVALQILGTQREPSDLDFSRYSDITGSFSGRYFRTSFNEQAKLLHVDLATRNDGQFVSDVPLLVGVKNVSDPSVRLVGFDGFMPDGTPYYDYSNFVAGGRLQPGQLTESPTVLFHNPNRVQFDYELVFLGKLNEAPYFTSAPRIEALAGRTYTYDADAIDPDDDPLAYSLLVAPPGMTIDESTGAISWTTTNDSIGQHNITVRTTDGRGGSAEQRYTLSVIAAPPNRPPVITSAPVTQAFLPTRISGTTEQILKFDEFEGINYGPGTGVEEFARLSTQYRSSHGVTFSSVGSVPYVAIVNLDTYAVGHSITAPNGIGGVTSANALNYGIPIQLRFTDPSDGSIPAVTDFVSYRTDSVGDNQIVRIEAFDINGELIGEASQVDFDSPEVSIRAAGIHTAILYGSSSSGIDNVKLGPLWYATGYQYNLVAIDPDDDTLAYQLSLAPDGMYIDDHSGHIAWSPTASQTGEHLVAVLVSDGRGGVAEQEFVVCVHPDPSNNPPIFVSQPPVGLAVRKDQTIVPFVYDAIAIDPDEDDVQYQLVDGPEGLEIDEDTGKLTWEVPSNFLTANQLVIEDGDYDLANWSHATYFSGIQGSATQQQLKSGGNPGSHILVTTSVPAASQQEGNVVYSIHRFNDFILDLEQNGAIHSIEYSEDIRWVSGRAQDFGLVLFQDDAIFLGPEQNAGTSGEWQSRGLDNLIASDFTYFDGETATTNRNRQPDLSATAKPITFGFYRSINAGIGSASFSGVTAADNWKVTITPAAVVGISIQASDGRGGVARQAFSLPISQAGEIVGQIFLDQNRDGIWQQPQTMLVNTAARFTFLSVDIQAGVVRAPFFTEPPENPFNRFYVRDDGTIFGVDFDSKNLVRIFPGTNQSEILYSGFPLQAPTGIAIASDGSVLVGDEVSNEVHRFDSDTGEHLGLFASHPSIRTPRDIAIGPEGDVYVLGSLSRTIHRFDGETGQFKSSISLQPSSFGNWMTFGPDGLIYVSGLAENWVKRYDPNTGTEVDVFLAPGTEGLDFPGDLEFGPDGHLYVTSRATNEVLVFNLTGGLVRRITSPELASPRFVSFLPTPSEVEPGLAGWTLFIDSSRNGTLDPGEPVAVTDPSGQFRFPEIAPGEHRVTILHEDEWSSTVPSSGFREISVSPAESVYRVDFGVIETGEQTANPDSDTVVAYPDVTLEIFENYVVRPDIGVFSGEQLRFELLSAPAGATIHPSIGAIGFRPSQEQIGRHNAIVRISDRQGRIDIQSFTITVNAPNTAPVFTSTPPAIAGIERTWRYAALAQDAEQDAVSFSVVSGPQGLVFDPTEDLFKWTTTAADTGTHPVVLRVSDTHGDFSEQTFTISVDPNAPNRAPIFTSQPRTNLQAGRKFIYPVEVFDPDGDNVNLQLVDAPTGMVLEAGRRVTWETSAALAGTAAEVRLRATDALGRATDQTFTLRLTAELSNGLPTIISQPRLGAVVDQPYAYDLVGFDPDGDPLRWQLAQAPLGMSLDASTGALRWTPRPDQIGRHSVIIEVRDAFNLTATQRFEIEVNCFNRNPAILSVPPTRALVDGGYLYPVRAIDPDGDTLRFELEEAPAGMTIDAQTGVIRWRPTAQQIDTYDVTIVARDPSGAVGRQSYQVVVALGTDLVDPNDPDGPTFANRAPLITSTPVFTAVAQELYRYDLVALDPDGELLTYSLQSDAPGMEIDPATGRISWTPTLNQVDDYLITVQATDERGAIALQSYLLSVRANQPPQIVSQPRLTATPEAIYRYTVRATDPDNDPLSYRLVLGPDGMTIDPRTGAVLWTPAVDLSGQFDVTVAATDNRGASDQQSFSVTLTPDTEAPRVTLVSSTNLVNVGDEVTYFVQATDNVGVSQLRLFVDGRAIALGSDGRVRMPMPQTGLIEAQAVATDRAGNEGRASLTIRVLDPNDTRVPSVSIISPVMDATLTYLTDIVGTVSVPAGQQLEYWSVEFAPTSLVDVDQFQSFNPAFREIGRGTNPVEAAVLAQFDPTMLLNGGYIIRLTAFNTNGQGWVEGIRVSIEGNAKIGNFRLEFTDLSVPLVGIPININRVYDTLQTPFETDFGHGWTLSLGDPQIFETVPAGQPFIPGSTKVFLTNAEGRRVGFTYDEEFVSGNALAGATLKPIFRPDPGVYDELEVDGQVFRGGIGGAFFNVGNALNPDLTNFRTYHLTNRAGVRYTYDQFDGLQKAVDRNGNMLTVTRDGIQHSSGVSIQYIRDHRGRISEIIDPDGQRLRYAYDARGNLIRFTNQESLSTEYRYLNDPAHYLDEAYDPLGRRVLKAVYDDDGRFLHVVDAAGNIVNSQSSDVAQRTAIVRDGNGNETQLLYDDRGNVLEETDPQGNVTYREYGDPNHPDMETRIIDRRGMVTDRSYDPRGNLAELVERGQRDNPLDQPVVTRFTYNSQDDVASITNAAGATTRFVYDDQGNLTQIINALGNSSHFTYDAQGQRSSFTDFNGNITRFDYSDGCPCGSPSRVTYADNTYETFEYNRFGQITRQQTFETDGTLVENKQTFYDSTGRVTREVMGSGNDPKHPITDVRKFYDGHLLEWEIIVSPESLAANGTLLESPATPVAQRKSRITEYKYDERDNLITQIDAMGGIVQFRYDAQGNRVLLQDPVGNITTWTYDELNRVAEERDPFYWVDFVADNSTLDIDAMLAAVVEENEEPSTASLTTNQGAAHVRSFAYDAEGNQSKMIDRNNRRREFSYDHAGRLLEERWYNPVDHSTSPGALVETINFTYDALGNMLTAADSNSRYLHTYDVLNRLTSVDNNPLNDRDVPRVILSYGYDAQGNVISTSDDAGVTVASEYDSRNRLAIRSWFDADIPTGETRDVDNARVDFLYTATGREKEVHRYSDLTGTNLVGRTLRSYDLAGRSNLLNHVNAVDEVIAGYDYDYDFSGLVTNETRTHQDPQYAQEIVYKYDLTGQLVQALSSAKEAEIFQYDLNGNRIGGDYETGPANQLTRGDSFRYEYDGEGNLIKKIEVKEDGADGEVTTYEFDHRNRLVRTAQWSREPRDGGILVIRSEYKDDAFGRRIVKNVDADGAGPDVEVRKIYIYNDHSSWADFNGQSDAVARHFFGNRIDQVFGRHRPNSGTAWYLTDAVGTVHGLTERTGLLINHTTYDVFGNITNQTNTDLSDRFQFQSREFDIESQLYNFRARYYSPTAGRFLNRDPIGFNGNDANTYRFLKNSAINFTDPTGLITMGEASFVSLQSLRVAAALSYSAAAAVVFFSHVPAALETFTLSNSVGEVNALRHCSWMARSASIIGPELAIHFGYLYELSNRKRGDYAIDLHNNRVGASLGAAAHPNADFLQLCIGALPPSGPLNVTGGW
ncbi:MAG: putative Ig domain-containing protein [Pirellulaceae bacterium]|nr:putative Ig domain-containing protein [Pirellulaceae bacterium]